MPRCKLPPRGYDKRRIEKGREKEEPLRFHTTWLTRFLGRGGGRDRVTSHDEEVESRELESVDCGALTRLGQSSLQLRECAYIHMRMCVCVCVMRS